jgi:hypothetical protein
MPLQAGGARVDALPGLRGIGEIEGGEVGAFPASPEYTLICCPVRRMAAWLIFLY